MNITELKTLLRDFAKISPSFWSWAEKQAEQAASMSGGSVDTEWDAQQASWQRTLQDVPLDAGLAVLRRIEAGTLEPPTYGELARTILRESKREAEAQKKSKHQLNYASEQRYRCATCRDSGIVEIWNPRFVEAYRAEFAKVTRTEIDRNDPKLAPFLDRFDSAHEFKAYDFEPSNWLYLASGWWRTQCSERPGDNVLSIHHVALCDCDCPRRESLHSELQKFLEGNRRNGKGDALGLPACGAARYNPRVMPRKTFAAYEDLQTWYASHEPNEVNQWQPVAGAYETNFS